jgi:DNA-binding response OmpR family regulator
MKRVLIVDDQPNIRKMIRLALGKNYVIEEAGDADQALSRIEENIPDGIVLDVMMPGSLNGFQLCERIKKDAVLAHLHVVLVTACGQVEDQEMGYALGADAYFIKPFSPLALARHLDAALHSAPGVASNPSGG